MKTNFIAKAIPVVMGCFILAIFLVSTVYAYKSYSNNESVNATSSCNDKLGNLTIFPFAKLKMSSSGSATRVEVHLTNADTDCSEMIYSSYAVGNSNESGTIRDNSGATISLR